MASIEVGDDCTVTEDNSGTSEHVPLCGVGTRMDMRSTGGFGCNHCPRGRGS